MGTRESSISPKTKWHEFLDQNDSSLNDDGRSHIFKTCKQSNVVQDFELYRKWGGNKNSNDEFCLRDKDMNNYVPNERDTYLRNRCYTTSILTLKEEEEGRAYRFQNRKKKEAKDSFQMQSKPKSQSDLDPYEKWKEFL